MAKLVNNKVHNKVWSQVVPMLNDNSSLTLSLDGKVQNLICLVDEDSLALIELIPSGVKISCKFWS